jgi:hypothetical protein
MEDETEMSVGLCSIPPTISCTQSGSTDQLKTIQWQLRDAVLIIFKGYVVSNDRLCGLVVRAPGYRSRGQGSIPRATRFSEK